MKFESLIGTNIIVMIILMGLVFPVLFLKNIVIGDFEEVFVFFPILGSIGSIASLVITWWLDKKRESFFSTISIGVVISVVALALVNAICSAFIYGFILMANSHA